ncbi:MAG: carboxyl transferase domain-containing protein [Burkholderiaceae bacterium]
MNPGRLLIANRGEVAIRIARAAKALGLDAVCVYSDDDASALHRLLAPSAVALGRSGPAAYLDADTLVRIALDEGCTAVHPGYGFLSENAAFARRCRSAGLVFVGPDPQTLDLLGDKAAARALARRLAIPVVEGTDGPTSVEQAIDFFRQLPAGSAMMIKAIAGGGGRGMRAVHALDEIAGAYERCRSEAKSAFGVDDLYVERLLGSVRHVEVQVLGDGRTTVCLGDRECSLQRRRQKLIEIAPAPGLDPVLRASLANHSLRLSEVLGYKGLGTFEYLVSTGGDGDHVFIEANARLQVEHTVTEAVTGIDLVEAQIAVALGRTLAELGLDGATPAAAGSAIELRVNLESIDGQGMTRAGEGVLRAFDLPSGPGIRVDSCGYTGLDPSGNFDSLIAKLVVHDGRADFATVAERARLAAGEFRIVGRPSNLDFLQAVLEHPDVRRGAFDTALIDRELPALVRRAEALAERRRSQWPLPAVDPATGLAADPAAGQEADPEAVTGAITGAATAPATAAATTAARRAAPRSVGAWPEVPPGAAAVPSPLKGRIVAMAVAAGDEVSPRTEVAVIEAMKMEHVVLPARHGVVLATLVAVGDVVEEGQPLLHLSEREAVDEAAASQAEQAVDGIRADLQEVLDLHAFGLDRNRPEAVARRHASGKRTARENVDDLLDDGSFVEYGGLVVAARRGRVPLDRLRRETPADGMIAGMGTVNRSLFDAEAARCMVIAYDYTVLAGSQGFLAHRKKDRMFELAERLRIPLVLFGEGGGGRPGDTDNIQGMNPSNPTFWRFARLSGLVPMVAIVTGRCFAGNAALVGGCDVIIATRDVSIGMGGPVMIEYGGLGKVEADDVGPVSFQAPNGVIDVVVDDEAQAVDAARRYLSYFQGPIADWQASDQRVLRNVIPENRLRVYDVRKVIATLADADSVMELRRDFGRAMVTALIRVEGRPIGVIANDPIHDGGAIASDEADKAARFMQLCDAYDIPLLSLVDNPGFMVGPDSERKAAVRHTSRMFVTAAGMTVPMFIVVLRKCYGLGGIAMGSGAFQRAATFVVAWPTGEFGPMGLEGAVRLAYRAELAAIDDPRAREALYQDRVDKLYQQGKAATIAPFGWIDDVIDPADTRRWITSGLAMLPAPLARAGKKRPNIDSW